MGEKILLVILVTFGLSIIIQNGLLEVYGADTHKVAGGWMETSTIALGPDVNVGLFSVLTFIAAVIVVGSLDLLLYRSGIGVKIRAVSDDVATADLIGLSSARIYGVAMGVSFVTIGIAAGFMSIWSNFDPSAGPTHLLIAFEVIVLGGLGSMWGSLAGGIVLSVAPPIGAQFDADCQIMAGHIVFLAVLVVRPHGSSLTLRASAMTATQRALLNTLRLALAGVAIGLAAGPFFLADTQLGVLADFFSMLVLAIMWNLLAGYADIVTIGQHAFVGVGRMPSTPSRRSLESILISQSRSPEWWRSSSRYPMARCFVYAQPISRLEPGS